MMIKDMTRFCEERTFGIEIEAGGVSMERLAEKLRQAGIDCRVESYNHTTRTWWKLTTDASLRGLSNAFELVSPVLKGSAGLAEVKKVCEVLTRLKAKVNRQCGLHVHHYAGDMTIKEFKNLVALYGRAEVTIDSSMPISRRSDMNQYCRSIHSKLMTDGDSFESIDNLDNLKRWMGGRYKKVNFEAFTRQQTIEFRQHSGTVEWQKVCNWIVFTQLLIQRSFRRVKVVRKDGPRYKDSRGWRSVVMDLGLEKKWPVCDAAVKGAIQHIVDRIKHFKNKESDSGAA